MLAVVAGSAAAARAHGPAAGAEELELRLEPLAPELAGVRVQLRHTVAPQLVVENATDRTLEVLDERGVAFVRIGPEGVEGNTAAPAWYHGLAPEETVPAGLLERLRSGEAVAARWVLVRREPTWGWFDARLKPESQARSAGDSFEVPVRIGDVASALRGRFVARPPRRGALRARLLSEPQLAPGVRITLVPGRAGSFLLTNDASEEITVLGREGEPFLRLGPNGVEANLHSATYAESARLRGGADLALESRADASPRWQRLSPQSRHAWVDLRTAADALLTPAIEARGERTELLRWTLPVRIGAGEDAELVRVEGVTVWEPSRSERRKAAPGGAEPAH